MPELSHHPGASGTEIPGLGVLERGQDHADHADRRRRPADVFRSRLVPSRYQRLAWQLHDRSDAMGSLRSDRLRRRCFCSLSVLAYAAPCKTLTNPQTMIEECTAALLGKERRWSNAPAAIVLRHGKGSGGVRTDQGHREAGAHRRLFPFFVDRLPGLEAARLVRVRRETSVCDPAGVGPGG